MANQYVAQGIPFLRSLNVEAGRVVLDDLKFIGPEFHNKLRKSALSPGDVVIVRTGKPGACSVIPSWLPEANCSDLVIVRCGPELDTRFLMYYINTAATSHVSAHLVGAVQQHFNVASARQMQIPLPSLPEQRAIAGVLGALDDKIELNRRMNQTLEEIARTIFTSWFVRFDPVRAKAEGRQPEGMDAATAALFPDAFVDSALGPIPAGWVCGTIATNSSQIQYGLTKSASADPTGPRFLRITDIRGGSIDWDQVPYCDADETEREKYLVRDGDIFVARTGASTGENVYVVQPPVAVFASYLVRLRFESQGLARIVGQFMRTDAYANYVAGVLGGSAQPNASAQRLAGASFAFPTAEVAEAFFRLIRPLDLKRAANDRERITLSAIRDLLLPKLLSGEVGVPEAERALAEVGA